MRRLGILFAAAALVAVIGLGVAGVVAHAEGTGSDRAGSLDEYVGQIWDAVADKLGIARTDLEKAVTEARQEVAEKAVADGAMDQTEADRITEGSLGTFGFRPSWGHDRGHMGHRGPFGCMGSGEALAEMFGMTEEELQAELDEGKSIDEIAQEKGVDLDEARIESMKDALAAKVEAGELTQEEADWMLEGAEQGYMGGRGGRMGFDRPMARPGVWGRGPGEPEAEIVPDTEGI